MRMKNDEILRHCCVVAENKIADLDFVLYVEKMKFLLMREKFSEYVFNFPS